MNAYFEYQVNVILMYLVIDLRGVPFEGVGVVSFSGCVTYLSSLQSGWKAFGLARLFTLWEASGRDRGGASQICEGLPQLQKNRGLKEQSKNHHIITCKEKDHSQIGFQKFLPYYILQLSICTHTQCWFLRFSVTNEFFFSP